jgi:uncharacterized protein YcbX
MSEPIGRIHTIFRHPVKSMAGSSVERAALGWYGIEGDRRFAFRRAGDNGGFPWLSASRLPRLVLYRPSGADPALPASVKTPEGRELPLGDELTAEIGAALGSKVELMRLRHGMFDETPVSIISVATMEAISREAGRPMDARRFRPNVVVDGGEAFGEDAWVGRVLRLGSASDAPEVAVTMRDERCSMVNLDPDTAEAHAEVMKAAVRLHGNHAGVYATVVRTGTISRGDTVHLER